MKVVDSSSGACRTIGADEFVKLPAKDALNDVLRKLLLTSKFVDSGLVMNRKARVAKKDTHAIIKK